MKRLLAALGFAALSATIVLAQQHNAGDMDKMQMGGSVPAGWNVRLDSGSTKPDGVNAMTMGTGVHFKTGPAGIYYRAADTKSGAYEVHASFNQVFMTDALVEPEMMLCDVGDGWKVATTTLMHERRNADGTRNWAQATKRKGRIYEEEAAEVATTMEPYKWYPQRAGRVDLILPRAKETGAINDPVIRQEIARLLIMSKSAEWTSRRARAAQEQGKPQGPEGSLGKLVSSHVARQAARVHTYMGGQEVLLSGKDGPMDGVITEILISVPAGSIAGGTDEIQRNIISERVLQMPKEPSVDTNKPFKDVPRNVVAKA